jgi:hypothetical protein
VAKKDPDPFLDGRTRAGRKARGLKAGGAPKGKPNPRKNKPPARLYTDEEMIAALEQSGGLVSAAARILDCADMTIYTRAGQVKAVARAMRKNRKRLVHDAEDVIAEKIRVDKCLKAATFVARTLGRARGYVEQHEHRLGNDPNAPLVTNGSKNLELDPEDLPPDVLRAILAAYEKKEQEARARLQAVPQLPAPAADANASATSGTEVA